MQEAENSFQTCKCYRLRGAAT
uniref:Uncharacterized protein n=1 Tax=Arundo donax TaxID=35708 RepID=A0A0A9EM70_ARUDO